MFLKKISITVHGSICHIRVDNSCWRIFEFMELLLGFVICLIAVSAQSSTTPNSVGVSKSCDEKIFNCTLLHIQGNTTYSNLDDIFFCVKSVEACSFNEEYFRNTLFLSILDVMYQVCPGCEMPTVPKVPDGVNSISTSDLPCSTGMMMCNAHFNIKPFSIMRYQSLYDCLLKISKCTDDFHQAELRWQQLKILRLAIKEMCHNCTEPAFPPMEPECKHDIFTCSSNGSWNFSNKHNWLTNVHTCLTNIKEDDCNSADEYFRNFLLHLVRQEMNYECPHCEVPDVSSVRLNAIQNAALHPLNLLCIDNITTCQAIFNLRPRGPKRYVNMYNCIQGIENCTPLEKVFQAQITTHLLQKVKIEYPGYFQPTSKPTTTWTTSKSHVHANLTSTYSPPTHSTWKCNSNFDQCLQRFQWTSKTCSDKLVLLECLTMPKDCELWEERSRNQYLSQQIFSLRYECTQCYGQSSPSPASSSQGYWPSPSPASSSKGYWPSPSPASSSQGYWPSPSPASSSKGYWPSPSNVSHVSSTSHSSSHKTYFPCDVHLSLCSSTFYDGVQGRWTAEEFYRCLLKPEGCNDWDEYERRRMLLSIIEYLDGENTPSSAAPCPGYGGILLTLLIGGQWRFFP